MATQHILTPEEQREIEDQVAAWIDQQRAIERDADEIIAAHRAKRQAEQAQ